MIIQWNSFCFTTKRKLSSHLEPSLNFQALRKFQLWLQIKHQGWLLSLWTLYLPRPQPKESQIWSAFFFCLFFLIEHFFLVLVYTFVFLNFLFLEKRKRRNT